MNGNSIPASPAIKLVRRDSDRMLIAFSALNAARDDRFHFTRAALTLPGSKLFLRDTAAAWYHKGLSGISRNIEETADFLRYVLAICGARRAVVVGASSGGYAALLLGRLLEADSVHAVSPRTFLDPVNRQRYGELRFARLMDELYAYPEANREYFDLAEFFARYPIESGEYHCYYSEADRFDRIHARHLHRVSGLRAHASDSGTHLSFGARLLLGDTLVDALRLALEGSGVSSFGK